MMRSIVVLGDIHGSAQGVGRIVEHLQQTPPDLVALVGDLGSDLLWNGLQDPPALVAQWQDSIDKILQPLEPLGVPVLLVPGNHDRPDPKVRKGCLNLDGRTYQLGPWRIGGIGGAGPAIFGLPYEWSEAEADQTLDRLGWRQDPPNILLCHAPPLETGLDRLLSGEPVGSSTLRKFVEAFQPTLYLCGHIHEAVGHTFLGRTLLVNAGRLIFADYDRFGRPKKGAETSFQFYQVFLDETVLQRLERVRLSCTGPLEVVEHRVWRAEDGFEQVHAP